MPTSMSQKPFANKETGCSSIICLLNVASKHNLRALFAMSAAGFRITAAIKVLSHCLTVLNTLAEGISKPPLSFTVVKSSCGSRKLLLY